MPKDQPVQLPMHNSEVVFAGKIWDVVREQFAFGDQQLTREFVKHPGAVAILALNDRQEFLLIRQYRHPVKSYLWEIPAGLLDVAGESLRDAAERELLEETGYQAQTLTELASFYTTPGGNSELITVFLAEGLEHVGYSEELEGEERDLQPSWVSVDAALEAVLKGDIRSPSAVVGIMAFALKSRRAK